MLYGFRRRLTALMVVTFLAALSAPAQENLLRDGDFEKPFQTVQDLHDAWTIWGLPEGKVPGNFSREENNPHGGKACLRVFHPAGMPGGWTGVLATPPDRLVLTPQKGKKYTATFWARAEQTEEYLLRIGSYQSTNPFVDGPTPATLYFKPQKEWTQFSVSFTEGQTFFASGAKYMYLGFFFNGTSKQDRTLWLDDITLIAEDSPLSAKLIDPADLKIPGLNFPLREVASIDMTVDPTQIRHKTNLLCGGISMMSLNRWIGMPYSKTGEYNLLPGLENGFRDLQLPLTRFYALLEKEPFTKIEDALDATAVFLDKINVPQSTTMLELEPWDAKSVLSPDIWARAAQHAVNKGYGFRHWEIGNEVYFPNTTFKSPEQYLKHVLEVSAAIRKVQPNSQIGMSVDAGENYLLQAAAGHYDFVCPHLYGLVSSAKEARFEEIVLGENHNVIQKALSLSALLAAYNPGKHVYIYDSEWGLHTGENADRTVRNGNIVGTIFRAVRLLYYARERIVGGASAWKSMDSKDSPGFAVMYNNAPDERSMLYWLYYYYNRNLEPNVIGMQGTAPYFESEAAKTSLPLTPCLATVSDDGKRLRLMLVNGSWSKDFPVNITIDGFHEARCESVLLKHDNPTASPVLKNKAEFVHDLQVMLTPKKISFTLPAHSVAFIRLDK